MLQTLLHIVLLWILALWYGHIGLLALCTQLWLLGVLVFLRVLALKQVLRRLLKLRVRIILRLKILRKRLGLGLHEVSTLMITVGSTHCSNHSSIQLCHVKSLRSTSQRVSQFITIITNCSPKCEGKKIRILLSPTFTQISKQYPHGQNSLWAHQPAPEYISPDHTHTLTIVLTTRHSLNLHSSITRNNLSKQWGVSSTSTLIHDP